ncbi:hypothetical protein J8281_13465 [Aquimarina sp. U1-2]|uniref:WD40 repeat domain-containing protein n=1 Tax=Aquimarina sp. U1-2 TaxID=2823141 RepID=UPI001AECA21A|nr:hypothetical protein [Aquimarina sp. U1-2]MBP2833197.1 hypothetical protein [Aquimarina sp. U1-2]
MKKIGFVIALSIVMSTQSCNDWQQIGESIHSEHPGDFTGIATAMSDDGAIIAIGSPYNDNTGIGAGQVRVFQEKNGQWVPLGNSIEGLQPYEHFGSTLAMNAEGNIISIGALHSSIHGENSGQVRVFKLQNQKWVQLGQSLNGSKAHAAFGYDISLSDNGETLAVGAPHVEPTGEVQSSITVYRWDNKTWKVLGTPIQGIIKTSYFKDNSKIHEVQIGKSLKLSNDGKSLIIATDGRENDTTIYQLEDSEWKQKGNSIRYNYRGYTIPANTVSINNDGSVIAIGYDITQISKYSNDSKRGRLLLNGHIQVFTLDSNNRWNQLGNTIYGTDLDHFAYKIELDKSGNRLAVTSRGRDPDGGPKDYNFVSVFELVNNQWQLFGERIKLERAYLDFPTSFAINTDGTRVIIGNSNMDDNHTTFGEVKIFKNTSK